MPFHVEFHSEELFQGVTHEHLANECLEIYGGYGLLFDPGKGFSVLQQVLL